MKVKVRVKNVDSIAGALIDMNVGDEYDFTNRSASSVSGAISRYMKINHPQMKFTTRTYVDKAGVLRAIATREEDSRQTA